MKELYTVAQNSFAVTVDDELHAWTSIRPRFIPFASSANDKPILEIDIKALPLPECTFKRVYEPAHTGIGFISARVSRLPDSSFVMEFLHVSDLKPHIWMRMTPQFDKADIITRDDKCDSCFLAHALMIAFMLSAGRYGTLLIHSSAVIHEGRAYLFQGKSGTGKSTHSALWIKNIKGAELLNDDNPVIRFTDDGVPIAYGSPWSGKTHCYRNVSAPIGAFVRIVQANHNALKRLHPLNAYASLTSSIFLMPFVSDDLMDSRHIMIERLVRNVDCFEMHCLPDSEAALICRKSLSDYSKNH